MVSKIFEKLVDNRLLHYLEKCCLFYDLQYGFMSSCSTADIVTKVSDRIARSFNRSGTSIVVALEISKAFNSVWHACLLTGLVFGFT